MKEKIVSVLLILSFLILLAFPVPVFSGASKGLLLWYRTVLPTLLPFMILSNFMIHTRALSYISRLAGPFIHRIFGVSYKGSFAVITGFFCGYPMGAKVTADLIRSEKISAREGNYLLSFCNNTSPMFIISYLVWQNLNRKDFLVPTLFILTLSPICCSFLFRFYWMRGCGQKNAMKKNKEKSNCHTSAISYKPLNFQLFDSCMMDSFEAIVKVGGYIMLFSILTELLQLLSGRLPMLKFLLPMLEITNGISLLCQAGAPFRGTWIQVLALTSFGGFCAAAQTECMIQKAGLKIAPYIIEKLITMLVTSLFAILYLTSPRLHP